MASYFVPKGQEGLLLRGPLAYGFSPTPYLPKTTQELHISSSLSERNRLALMEDRTPRKTVGFYTRNNPHPARVRHMKGLLDVPICYVEDNMERSLPSPTSGTDFGPPFRPQGSTRYAANKLKGAPAVGVVPVTYAWRDELEGKAQVAINRALRKPPVSRSGGSRSASIQSQPKQEQLFGHVNDEKVLDLLCKILQTDSIPSCQAWLANASETEKNIVLNMIRMVSLRELDSSVPATRPQTHESQYRYIWTPKQSQVRTPYHTKCYHGEDKNIHRTNTGTEVEATHRQSESTSKYPEHDTIIKTARQLASLVSRQSLRAEKARSLDLSELHAHEGAADTGGRSQSQKHHWRSSSLSGLPTDMYRQSSRRPWSKSATIHRVQPDSNYPPPPVKAAVTKERIRSGTLGRKIEVAIPSH